MSDLPVAAEQLDAVMASLCYRTDFESTEGDSPAALGNRIAAAVIEYGRDDGALENERYVDSSYAPVNDPLLVTEPGTEMSDPNAWQPLALEEQIAQNGLPIPGTVQTFIGPHWGHVTSVRPAAVRRRHPDRSGSAAAPRRLGDRRGVQAGRRHRAPLQQRARRRRTASRSTSDPGALGDNTLGDQRRRRARREPGDRRAVRAERRLARRLRAGRSPSSGPTGRSRRPRRATGT